MLIQSQLVHKLPSLPYGVEPYSLTFLKKYVPTSVSLFNIYLSILRKIFYNFVQ